MSEQLGEDTFSSGDGDRAPAGTGPGVYPWEWCRVCGGERDVKLAKVCRVCIETGRPFPAVGDGYGDCQSREALYDALARIRDGIFSGNQAAAVAAAALDPSSPGPSSSTGRDVSIPDGHTADVSSPDALPGGEQ